MQDPSPWIERFADRVPAAGHVLDIACGGGRHSQFFLGRGHPVTALDRDVSRLTPQAGLEIIQHDLEDGRPWPLHGSQFAAVIVVNYLHRPLFPNIIASIAPGGLLLYDTFAVGNEAFGRPSNPDFLLREGELETVVGDEFDVIEEFHGQVTEPKPAVKQYICAIRD